MTEVWAKLWSMKLALAPRALLYQTRLKRLRAEVLPVFGWGCAAWQLGEDLPRIAGATIRMTRAMMRTHCIEPDTRSTWHVKSWRAARDHVTEVWGQTPFRHHLGTRC